MEQDDMKGLVMMMAALLFKDAIRATTNLGHPIEDIALQSISYARTFVEVAESEGILPNEL